MTRPPPPLPPGGLAGVIMPDTDDKNGLMKEGVSYVTHTRRFQEWSRWLADLMLFYTTAFFVLLAVFSIFSLIFLVPFFIDPAWSTLRANFDVNGTVCTTVQGVYREGKSHCDWSSCEEGCTKTVYTCWHIIVEFEDSLNIDFNRDLPQKENEERNMSDEEETRLRQLFKDPIDDYDEEGVLTVEELKSWRRINTGKRLGRLFPNVKGCGYPPRTNCTDFLKNFAKVGSSFKCHVSQLDPRMTIVDLDLNQVRMELFYSLIVPLPCLVLSVVYLFVAYFYIYKDPPEQSYRSVASLMAASNVAAIVDVNQPKVDGRDGGNPALGEEAANRRRLLMQAQQKKAKIMTSGSQQDKSKGSVLRTAVAAGIAGQAAILGGSGEGEPTSPTSLQPLLMTPGGTTPIVNLPLNAPLPQPNQLQQHCQSQSGHSATSPPGGKLKHANGGNPQEEQSGSVNNNKDSGPGGTGSEKEGSTTTSQAAAAGGGLPSHFDKMQADRKEFSQNKIDINHYYQYYGLL